MKNTLIIGTFFILLGAGIILFSLTSLSSNSLFMFQPVEEKVLEQNYLITPNLANPINLEQPVSYLVIEEIN